MTKQKLLFVGIGAVVLFIALAIADAKLGLNCSIWTETGSIKWCESLFLGVLVPFILLVPFSLLTYKMRDEVFRSWLHFAYWWVPISIVLTLLAGGGSGGGFGMSNVLDQEFFAFMFAALFTIISLIIIARKYFATRHK